MLTAFTDSLFASGDVTEISWAPEDTEFHALQSIVIRIYQVLGQIQPDVSMSGRIKTNLSQTWKGTYPHKRTSQNGWWTETLKRLTSRRARLALALVSVFIALAVIFLLVPGVTTDSETSLTGTALLDNPIPLLVILGGALGVILLNIFIRRKR